MSSADINTVIGVDPDSEAHGVAIYEDRKLISILNLSRNGLLELIMSHPAACGNSLVSLENVLANQFVYSRNIQASKAAQSKVAMHIGRCQQAQVELMRDLDYYKVRYVLHKPQNGNWAKNKEQFEKVTGWTGRSNDDQRSAAFFGFLALKTMITRCA